MNRFMRDFRLLPVVLFATGSLLALKVGGLVVSGGYTFTSQRAAQADGIPEDEQPVAQGVPDDADVTGSVAAPKPAEKEADGARKGDAGKPAAPVAPPPAKAEGRPVPLEDNAHPQSPAERAVLERLQQRRQELDQRARELDIREGLLAAAEKRIEARVLELKDIEARIKAAGAKKDEAEAARFKSLVTMYENMKAKEAARIFDRLDIRVLLEVATQINPRRMSDILAQMSSEAAERLTVELATRSRESDRAPSASDLPKIEGRPPG